MEVKSSHKLASEELAKMASLFLSSQRWGVGEVPDEDASVEAHDKAHWGELAALTAQAATFSASEAMDERGSVPLAEDTRDEDVNANIRRKKPDQSVTVLSIPCKRRCGRKTQFLAHPSIKAKLGALAQVSVATGDWKLWWREVEACYKDVPLRATCEACQQEAVTLAPQASRLGMSVEMLQCLQSNRFF